MKPRLYLTAEGLAEPSAKWHCIVWAGDTPQQTMTLAQAARLLLGRSVELLLPMEMCSWVRTDPWLSRRHPGEQTIAFAVEDQLSESLEHLHLAIGARDLEGRYPVMVIGRERFAALLALLGKSGIAVGSVWVDADVLPAEQPLGVRWCGRWLFGGKLPARLALIDEALPSLYGVLPADIQWLDERLDAVHVDQLLSAPAPTAIDLRSGAFSPQRAPMPWRTAGISILTLVLLTWVGSEARARFVQNQTRALTERNQQRFAALYPGQPRVADLAVQLKALQMQRTETQHSHVARLASLMERVVGASNVDVQRIDFRAGEGWKVQLTANSFAELERLRERGRQQGMPVQFDSASQQRNRVHVTLTLEDGV